MNVDDVDDEDADNQNVIDHLKIKRYLRRVERGRIIAKVFLTFLLQMVIVVVLFNYFMLWNPIGTLMNVP